MTNIKTNMSLSKLSIIMNAIKNNKVKWNSHSEYAGSRLANFTYKGMCYEITEWFEEITSLYKKI